MASVSIVHKWHELLTDEGLSRYKKQVLDKKLKIEGDRLAKTKSPRTVLMVWGLFSYKIGGDLLSHTVAHAVPSALKSLTSVFGMRTGGSSSL